MPSRHSEKTRRIRVAVASDQSLIAEAVRAALVDRRFHARVVRWPAPSQDSVPSNAHRVVKTRARVGTRQRPEALLILSPLERLSTIAAAQRLIESLGVPCLVLADMPAGPAWGAVLASGARYVAPTSTTLNEVTQMLDDLVDGPLGLSERRVRELVRQWDEFRMRRETLAARMQSLSRREEQVLELLHTGATVRTIAEEFGVSEATVRSQVKSLLRKLDVSSQIAAVAGYELLAH